MMSVHARTFSDPPMTSIGEEALWVVGFKTIVRPLLGAAMHQQDEPGDDPERWVTVA